MKDKSNTDGGEIGVRLLTARQATGMSTRKVVDRLASWGFSTSHTTVANYERGRTRPSLELLGALADVYGVSIDWFLQSGPVLTAVRYRALMSVTAGQKKRFEAISQRWLYAYCNLERELGEPLENRFKDFVIGPEDTGAGVAERLRQCLRLGSAPISSVIDVLETFGIRVIEVRTQDRIDGIAAHLGAEKVVVLNATLCPERTRLNAAHELGHHLFGDMRTVTGMPAREIEKRAFEFGSHFLLPQEQLVAALEGLSVIRMLRYKERFGVSMAAMIYRAKQTKLITHKVYQKFWMKSAKRGWRTNEPGVVLPDRATRFERMLESAIRNEVLTWRKAANIARVRENELRERLSAALPGVTGGQR